MKKIYLFILPIFVFIGSFICINLKSYAYDQDYNYPTAGVTVYCEWSNSTNNVVNKREFESIYPLVFYKTGDGVARIATPLQYGRMRTFTSSFQQDFSNWSTMSWQKINDNPTIYAGETIIYSGTGISFQSSNCIIFKDLQSVIDYFEDPENSDNIENVENGVGQDILEESTIPDVDWGNGIPYMDGSIPSQSIPAPKFNVSGGQSGNITKNITFLNFEYDSRAQDGKYGLVLYMKWSSLDDFYLNHTGGPFADTYKVTYGQTLPWGDYVFVYDVPEKENQVNYCPQSFSFTSNQACVNGFQSYLTNYPINSRTIDGPTEMNSLTGVGPIESFSDYLSKPECPYNTLIFYCYYYRKMPDGHFEFGPSSTGTFYPPSQNAIFNMNSKTSNDQGSMNSGYGGGASGESDDPFNSGNNWNQQWGDNTPNIDYGQHADPQALVSNISDLFGLIGQMPSFMGQLFVFLPTWLINFISVCIALAIAIGVVKLFIG